MSIYLAVFAGLLKQKQAVIFDMARHKEVDEKTNRISRFESKNDHSEHGTFKLC